MRQLPSANYSNYIYSKTKRNKYLLEEKALSIFKKMYCVKVVDIRVKVHDGVLDYLEYVLEYGGVQYFRVVRLVRLCRNPREYAQIETALEIHRDFVGSTRVLPEARLVLLACNSRRLGLIWCYGIAVTSLTEGEAVKLSKECFEALLASLSGSYRQAEYRFLSREEVYEILRLMQSKHGLAILGVPEPRDSYAVSPRELGFRVGVKIIEMIEELVRGLLDREFVYIVLAEPVEPVKLVAMFRRVLELASKYSDYQENISIGFGLSIPVGFTLTKGLSESIAGSESKGSESSRSVSRGVSEGQAHTVSEASSKAVSRGHSTSTSTTITKGSSTTESFTKSVFASKTHGSSVTHSTSSSSSVTRVEGKIYSKPAPTKTTPLGEAKEYLVPHSYKVSQSGERTIGVWEGYHEKAGGVGFKGNPKFSGNVLATGVKITVPAYGYYEGGERGYERREELKTDVKNIEIATKSGEPVLVSKSLPPATKTTPLAPSVTWYSSDYKQVSTTSGTTVSHTSSSSETKGWSRSHTVARSHFTSVSRGKTVTDSTMVTEGYTRGSSDTVSRSRQYSETEASSEVVSEAESRGLAHSEAESVVAGIWPSIYYSYSRIRSDEVRKTAYQLLVLESQRYSEMVSQGGFYVQAVLAAPDETTVLAAKALLIGAYAPTKLIPHPLRVVDADYRLLQCARTFSFDLRKGGFALEPYRYINIYTCTELASLTHPPRLEAPGLENIVENIPEFRTPPPRSYDVEFGYVLSHETGQLISIRYGIDRKELLHALFLGITRSGKTNAALVFVSRLVNSIGARALVLDWKKDWRRLLVLCKPCRFYTLYSDKFYPLKFNPLKPPRGVDVETWRDIATLWFSVTYGLGPRSYSLIWSKLDELYEAHGLYDDPSAQPPTLLELYEAVGRELDELRRDRRTPFDVLDIYQKTLDRLKFYTRGKFKKLFCSQESIDIGELLEEKGVTVIEAGELADIHKPFLLGLLAIACFLYRKFNGASSIPELIVLEEAHQIAFDIKRSQIAGMLNITENIFDRIASESAGYNQYLVMIAQYPSILGDGVRKNCGFLAVFKLVSETRDKPDVTMTTEMLARDSRLDHREVKRFLTRLPVGWSIVRKMRTTNLTETEPVLIKWDYIETKPPTDQEINNLVQSHK